MISRYVKADSADAADTFNHFSLLKTIEDLFSVPQLGYAKDTSLPEFDTVVFNNFTAGLTPSAARRPAYDRRTRVVYQIFTCMPSADRQNPAPHRFIRLTTNQEIA